MDHQPGGGSTDFGVDFTKNPKKALGTLRDGFKKIIVQDMIDLLTLMFPFSLPSYCLL